MFSCLSTKVKFRDKYMPKTWYDTFVCLFIIIIIPTVFWFEIFVVLNQFYDETSVWRYIHFYAGLFILINICTNYFATITIDTSVKGLILKPQDMWKLCSVCETLVPPRSYHCNICNICILRRDHHCVFSGCCIGLNNYRYFFYFMFYMFIATVYSSYFNIFFIYSTMNFNSWFSYINIVFPLAMLLINFDMHQLYLFLTLIVFVGMIFTGVLLYFHTNLLLKGQVTYESKHNINKYNLGKIENIKQIFGMHWKDTWISPFVISPLPTDGQLFPVRIKDM
ncbi:hypothetical protein AMK59_2134 [Oryctes borbonicus]|uniref:Palmitoyltransferase n=1 Tax=Oryctes borbonicus TaxID=1629725 RepID=A0A0T6BEL1_9SCAR|nr:hypothetical protein AMK59_2134 [Oryctes borbonicus]